MGPNQRDYLDFRKQSSLLPACQNLAFAISVFKDILRSHPKTGFVILGDGPQRENLEKHVEISGIGGSVVFLGWRENIYSYLKKADAYLNTSLFEGYGISILEAIHAGLPVVTSDVGGVGHEFNNSHVKVCDHGDI